MTIATQDENLWRDYINSLEAMDELSENKDSIQKDTQVDVQRITTVVYMFYNTLEKRKRFSHQASMKMESLGTMTWDEAQSLVKKKST